MQCNCIFLMLIGVSRQVLGVVPVTNCYKNSYLKTHEGLCGPNNLTNGIDALIDHLYDTIKTADEDLGNPRNYPPDSHPEEGEEFDFIVVGAGAAGSVVAGRLSEVPQWRVLLLEAGGSPPRASEVPPLAGTLERSENQLYKMFIRDFNGGGEALASCTIVPKQARGYTEKNVDWQYRAEPSEYCCLSINNNSCLLPRGKVLGGSTIINGMMYMRGNPQDFDDWRQPGWRYDQVLPYFKKSQDMRVRSLLANREERRFYGVGGPLKVEAWLNEYNPVANAFLDAMQEVGYPFNPDCNGERQLGVCPAFGTLEDHRRCSAAKAFLTPARDRSNLVVSRNSLVTKILIENSVAYGVEFINQNGLTVRVRASKEVIVSGGIINSPQLLMLSGVGPKDHLTDLGIPVIQDLPVGENYIDHVQLNLYYTIDYDPPKTPPASSTLQFLLKEPSSLSVLLDQSISAFLNISQVGYPDVQFSFKGRFAKNSTEAVKGFIRMFDFNEEFSEQLLEINKNAYLVVIQVALLRPCSRGRVLLKSKNPLEYPRIVGGYLEDMRDVRRHLVTLDFFKRLTQLPGLKELGTRFYEVRLSDCDHLPRDSFAYRECYVRHLSLPAYHQAGTCAMGSVLDAQLRVRGVSRLRVADSTVMPFLVSANTMGPIYMIGEKAADMIKRVWLPRGG